MNFTLFPKRNKRKLNGGKPTYLDKKIALIYLYIYIKKKTFKEREKAFNKAFRDSYPDRLPILDRIFFLFLEMKNLTNIRTYQYLFEKI